MVVSFPEAETITNRDLTLDDNLPGKLTYPEIQPDLFYKVKTELLMLRMSRVFVMLRRAQ